MNSFDIIGPVMVGPSSSHTAGACKIGNIAKKLMGEPIADAQVMFHGSFLATGKGHGTDRALIAGLLGFPVDDPRIPDSFRYAEEAGLTFRLLPIDLGDAHPNSVKMVLTGKSGNTLTVTSSSVGGGAIRINEIDGLKAEFSGDFPTLIVHNEDRPGRVTEVTSLLGKNNVNVATMQLHRAERGGSAVMILECDQEVPPDVLDNLRHLEGILDVTYLSLK